MIEITNNARYGVTNETRNKITNCIDYSKSMTETSNDEEEKTTEIDKDKMREMSTQILVLEAEKAELKNTIGILAKVQGQ